MNATTVQNEEYSNIQINPFIFLLGCMIFAYCSITITDYFRENSFKDRYYPEPNIRLIQMNPIPLYTHESSEEDISSYQI